jgi:hypothetical protein
LLSEGSTGPIKEVAMEWIDWIILGFFTMLMLRNIMQGY